MKLSILLPIIFLFVGLVGGYIFFSFVSESYESSQQPLNNVGEKEPLSLFLDIWAGYAPAIIALEKGFFEKRGVNVNINVTSDYSNLPDKLKRYDGFFGTYPRAILLNGQGTPVKVVYVSDFSDGADVIVSKPEIKNVKDLEGKTISVEELDTYSHLFVISLLNKFGVEEASVNFVEIHPSKIIEALEEDRIDAGHTWEPTQTQAIDMGYKLLITSVDTPRIITDVLILNEDVVKNRNNDVRMIVDGLFEALEFIDKNPDEAHIIIDKKLGIPKKEFENSVKWLKFPNREENVQAFTELESDYDLTSLYESGKFISEFYVTRGLINGSVDVNALLDSRFVRGDENPIKIISPIIVVILILILILSGFFIGRYFDLFKEGRK
ncbi:MAG: ABC transporter substrate-binding protein [Nanoarchaeota archaeon]|nr:ABC transporter substrate-binding protein [Nanoarchaeota archaeon]